MKKEIGIRIKDRRLELNYTQDELAKKIGLKNRASISCVESGRKGIPLNEVSKWCKALQLTPAELMGYDKTPEEDANFAADVLLDSNVMQMLKDYYTLSEEQQQSIRNLIASMKKPSK